MYYVFVENGKIKGTGELRAIGENILNIEISESQFNKINENPEKYVFKDGLIVENPDYETAQQEKRRKYLDSLSMRRGDVFEALILAKGLTKAQIRKLIEEDKNLDDITRALYLNRFDEALEFYRGYPIFDLLGEKLGITGDMLDEFFASKDYKKLIAPVIEETSKEVQEFKEDESKEGKGIGEDENKEETCA